MTKEQILKKLQERKAAKNKTLQEAKKAVAKKKPVLSKVLETTKAVDRKVVREDSYQNQIEPRTISEAINQRTAKMNKEQKHLYATLAENIANMAKIQTEATQAGVGVAGTIGTGAGVGLMKTYFDIFFGYFPSLITPMLASVQPIKTERASIFYYQTVAGSTKGNVAAGDVLIHPFGVNTDVNYTSNVVDFPMVDPADADSITGVVAYEVELPLWGPYAPNSVVIDDAELTWAANNVFTGTIGSGATAIAITNGAVTVANDNIKIEFKAASAPSRKLKVSYAYDNKYAPTQIPELNANINTREVVAKTRTVKTNYSFQAGFGFEAQFGAKLEDKLAEAAMYELKRATDLEFVFAIMNAAPTRVTWNKAAGIANGLYEIHKQSFRDAIIAASNHIFAVSKRVRGNVLLVGINAQTVVETLPDFKGDDYGTQLGGARKIGSLKGIEVVAIPELDANDWAVIYKDKKDNLDAGIVFAPYIPVIATSPVMLDDLVARRAYTCSYGLVITNENYFVKGTIINNPIAQPVFVVGKDGETYGVLGDDAVLA